MRRIQNLIQILTDYTMIKLIENNVTKFTIDAPYKIITGLLNDNQFPDFINTLNIK